MLKHKLKMAQASTDKFLLPKPAGTWKKPYRPRSSLLSTASLVKAQMAQDDTTLAMALAKVISAPSVCQFCQRNHNQESARELDKSSKQKPFKCQFCQEIFTVSCLFIGHMESHTGKSLYRCEFCGILFVDFFSMIAHRKDHLSLPCKLCSQKFLSAEELAKHITSVHSQKKKTPRLSKLSKKAFSLKVDLILEQNTNVLKPTHTCEICYKSFPLLSHLLAHKKCHTKEKPFKCDICGKNFKHSTVLKIHQQQHSGNEVYVCEHCGRVFSQCRHLAAHVRTHAREKLNAPTPEESGKSSPLLLGALMNNSPAPGLLQPGQILNASGTIENLIPAHSNGKVPPVKVTDANPTSPMDVPLDFRQQTTIGAVRSSVIRQVSIESNVVDRPNLQLNNRENSGKASSAPPFISRVVSPTSLSSPSSIPPCIISPSVSPPALKPATVSSITNPVSHTQVVTPTSAGVSPVSLVRRQSPETVTTLPPTSVVCSDMTKTFELQRPASAEAPPISHRPKIPVVRSASIDQATVKDLCRTPRLPLKLQMKEEPEKWLTNMNLTSAITSSTPSSPMIIPEPKRVKIEKMYSDPGVPINYTKPDTKDENQLEQISPTVLVKCEPMEISKDDEKSKDPKETALDSHKAPQNEAPNSREVPHKEPTNQTRKVMTYNSFDQSIVLAKVNPQDFSPPDGQMDNISMKVCEIREDKSSLSINAESEAPLSLVKREPIPNSSRTPSPLMDALKNTLEDVVKIERLTPEESNMVNDQISRTNDVCNYCKKTHNKELMSFLESTPADKPYKCHFCSETFSVVCLFSQHIEEHTGKILYQCDVCHKIFDEFLLLIFHRKTVHQGYVCNQCNQVFVCESDLKRHTRLGHYVEKTYNCEYCGKTFLQKCNLTFHRHTHTGEQPYSCEECGRKFARPGSLNAHMRTHSRLKPHKCDMCDKAFNTIGRLRCHTRLHVREMMFKCDLCERSFPQSKGLREHVRRWHNDEKLTYECEECGKRYMYSYMLIQHRLSHRGKNILKEVVTDTLTTHKKME